jgi:hypothetical protein
MFRAFSDPIRLRILNLLRPGELLRSQACPMNNSGKAGRSDGRSNPASGYKSAAFS